jgi:hypothetical protein
MTSTVFSTMPALAGTLDDRILRMSRALGFLPTVISVLALAAAPVPAAASVLVFAPPEQSEGATDSAMALTDSLAALGVPAVESTSLSGQDLTSYQAVLAVLGTYPRKHALTAAEGDLLTAYLRDSSGSLYIEGGDAWADMPAALAAATGIGLRDDGSGDLAVLEGLDSAPGPSLEGLAATYGGENRSIDRLVLVGSGARALWRNPITGAIAGVFNSSPAGARVIGVTFEFGGLPEPRQEVLRSYLIALGALPACAPAVRDLSSAVSGRRVSLAWKPPANLDSIVVERDGDVLRTLPAGATGFEDLPGPGEHDYRVIGVLGGCRSAARFASVAVIDGAHVIWQPAETIGGLDDSAGEVRAALEANQRRTVTVADLAGLDLHRVAGLWAVLGTHPFNHQLSTDEGQLLADYLAGGRGPHGPRLYIEGGDLWGANPPTPLRALDGVTPVADGGAHKLRHLRGLPAGGLDVGGLVKLPVDYTSETDSLDVIAADPAAGGAAPAWVDDDSGEVLGVFRRDQAADFALLSVSFEFGGVTHTREERALLMQLYLTALESPRPVFRRGDVDGTAEVSLTDAIQVLGFLFLAEALGQDCLDAADVDDDGVVGLTDVVVVLGYLFLAGPPPAPPGPSICGPDPTEDDPLPDCHPLASTCH